MTQDTEAQIDIIRSITHSDFPDVVKMDKINEVVNPPITIEDLSEAHDEGYNLGSAAGKGNVFILMTFWGLMCGAAGFIISLAVM